jgi:uncharacterized protein (TIGR02118 family)
MIRVSVLYPNSEGATFDMPYYLDSHMPMVREKLGSTLLKEEIWKGLGAPGDKPATYQVLLHMFFDSPESFNTAFGAHAGTFMADIPNYTNIQPVIELEAGV